MNTRTAFRDVMLSHPLHGPRPGKHGQWGQSHFDAWPLRWDDGQPYEARHAISGDAARWWGNHPGHDRTICRGWS